MSQPLTTGADDEASVVGEPALQTFASTLRGAALRPDDSGYDEARSIWNAMIDKRPAVIARCTGTADVVAAVNFARESGLPLSVRGNGHNIAGTAVCEGGVMIDLSLMRGIHIDREARVARVQPGCNWGDVDREGQLFGLTVPGGIVSTTGVAGLTLGGGFGWMTRRDGFTSDNLLSADVVLADGSLIRASEEQNADLFWGLRGGGGNFGVVTSFEFRLRPMGPEVMAGMVLHPIDRAAEVVALYGEMTAAAPDELSCLLLMRKAPPAPFLPKEVHGQPVVGIAVCYAGPVADGEDAVRPIKAFGTPLADVIAPKPFTAHQAMLDGGQPFGRRYYWKSDYFETVSAEVGEILAAQTKAITSPHSAMLAMHLGGMAKRLDADSAVGHREAEHVVNVQGSWEDGDDAPHIAWTRDTFAALQPHSLGGGYVNFLTEEEPEERVRAAYGPAIYGRLAAIKAQYDPDNLFRLNQNIKPAA